MPQASRTPASRLALLGAIGLGLTLAGVPARSAPPSPAPPPAPIERVPLVPAASEAQGDREPLGASAARVFDGGFVRPLQAARVLVGFGFFVASTPITALAGRVPEAWELLVRAPADSTFRRPLGQP